MVTFRIEDMTCGHCAGKIARAIAGVDRDARIEVDIGQKLVRITGAASDAELGEAIGEAGYTPRKVEGAAGPARASAGGCCCGTGKQAAVDGGPSAARCGRTS